MTDVKRYLDQLKYIDLDIQSRFLELNILRKNKIAGELFEIDEKISENINRLIGVKEKISKEIDQMDTYKHKIILRERYINRKMFEQISYDMNLSERSIMRLHKLALDEFSNKFAQEIEEFSKR